MSQVNHVREMGKVTVCNACGGKHDNCVIGVLKSQNGDYHRFAFCGVCCNVMKKKSDEKNRLPQDVDFGEAWATACDES